MVVDKFIIATCREDKVYPPGFRNSRAPPLTPRHVSENVCTQQEHRVLLLGNFGSKQEILAYFVGGRAGVLA